MDGLGIVTLGERPSRVSVAISGLLVGGLAALLHPGWETTVVLVAAVVWLALGAIGLVQLGLAVRRELSG
jgi:CDP-diacylglycerol--glycerol-3-phosphate 3-phosphatidyltransferase